MNNILLIGFMGSGKTTVGKLLSEKLNRELIDTDDLIVNMAKMKIEDIFKEKGEGYFRNLETEICKSLVDFKDKIISCGGGIIIKDENVQYIKEAGKVILLKVSKEEVLKRTKNEYNRPLLQVENKEEKIEELLNNRKEKYECAADVIIDTDGLTVDEVVDNIISEIRAQSTEGRKNE